MHHSVWRPTIKKPAMPDRTRPPGPGPRPVPARPAWPDHCPSTSSNIRCHDQRHPVHTPGHRRRRICRRHRHPALGHRRPSMTLHVYSRLFARRRNRPRRRPGCPAHPAPPGTPSSLSCPPPPPSAALSQAHRDAVDLHLRLRSASGRCAWERGRSGSSAFPCAVPVVLQGLWPTSSGRTMTGTPSSVGTPSRSRNLTDLRATAPC